MKNIRDLITPQMADSAAYLIEQVLAGSLSPDDAVKQ
jgi:hypothetical protein